MYSMIRLGRFAGELFIALLRMVLVLLHEISGGILRLGRDAGPRGMGRAVELPPTDCGKGTGRAGIERWIDLPHGWSRKREMSAGGVRLDERVERGGPSDEGTQGPGRSGRLEEVLRRGGEMTPLGVDNASKSESMAGAAGPAVGGAARLIENRKERKRMNLIPVVVSVLLALCVDVLIGAILGFERGGVSHAALWGGALTVGGVILGGGCFYLGMRLTVKPAPRGGSSGSAAAGRVAAPVGGEARGRGRVVELVGAPRHRRGPDDPPFADPSGKAAS